MPMCDWSSDVCLFRSHRKRQVSPRTGLRCSSSAGRPACLAECKMASATQAQVKPPSGRGLCFVHLHSIGRSKSHDQGQTVGRYVPPSEKPWQDEEPPYSCKGTPNLCCLLLAFMHVSFLAPTLSLLSSPHALKPSDSFLSHPGLSLDKPEHSNRSGTPRHRHVLSVA